MAEKIFSGNCYYRGATIADLVGFATGAKYVPYSYCFVTPAEVSVTTCAEETGILTKNDVP